MTTRLLQTVVTNPRISALLRSPAASRRAVGLRGHRHRVSHPGTGSATATSRSLRTAVCASTPTVFGARPAEQVCPSLSQSGAVAAAPLGLSNMRSGLRGMTAAAQASGAAPEGRGVQQMGVHELKEILEDDDLRDSVQLVDVREEWEAEQASLPHFTLLPMSRQQEWAGVIAQQMDLEKHTIVLCHHGMRSNMVANFLVSEQAGFENVSNVIGGIDAYASVDARTPRY